MTEPNAAPDRTPPLHVRALVDDGKGEGWDPTALRRAEQAMSALSKDFGKWMNEETVRLDETRRRYHAAPADPEQRAALFRAAHDMRGHAGTFGFPLATVVAEGLCELIEKLDRCGVGAQALVDAHVDAIRAIERDGVRDAHNKIVLAVIAALGKARQTLTQSGTA